MCISLRNTSGKGGVDISFSRPPGDVHIEIFQLLFKFLVCMSVWNWTYRFIAGVYRQWSRCDEAGAGELLVMAVSCRFHQRPTGTRRVTPDESE